MISLSDQDELEWSLTVTQFNDLEEIIALGYALRALIVKAPL